MKYLRFLKTFFSLVFRHWTWEMSDGTFSPPKSRDTLIGVSTAFRVAHILHLET